MELPPELVELVLTNLGARSLCAVRSVCKVGAGALGCAQQQQACVWRPAAKGARPTRV